MVADIRIIPMNVPIKKFEAPGKKIVVWVEPPPDKHGQLHMPDGSKSKMATPIARIVALGPEVSSQFKEGQRILLYDNTLATEIRYDGDTLHAIEENSIVGILPVK